MVESKAPSDGRRWRNLRTGLVFTLGMALVGVLAAIIGKNTSAFSSKVHVKIFVQDVKGLNVANFVSVAGKKVGVVSGLNFVRRSDTLGIEVTLQINSEYAPLISKNSVASVKSQGVLGDKYVDIQPLNGAPIAEGDELTTGTETGLEDITKQAASAMTNLGTIISRIEQGEGTIGKLLTTDELNNKLLATVSNVESLMYSLKHGDGLAAQLLSDGQLSARVRTIADNMTRTTASLDSLAVSIRQGQGTLGMLATDDGLYRRLESVVQKTDAMVGMLSGDSSLVTKISRDAAIYDNMNRTIISLDSLLRDLKENPGRYVTIRVF